MTQIATDKEDLQTILLESFRYCLGRRTYAVNECVERLLKHWDELPEKWQTLICENINFAMEHGTAGGSCDIAEWKKILEKYEAI